MKSLLPACLLLLAASTMAELPKEIRLPVPRKEGGKPLLEALAARRTSRSFSPAKLPPQTLSDLLWAANGVNRPENGMRTAPSAMNWQEIEVYAVLEEGTFLYDPKENSLKPAAEGDLRKLSGQQAFAATAPLNLLFVADTARMKGATPEDQTLYSWCDAGYVSQNVYLFCASEGLATVVRGLLDRKAMAEALKLPETKKVILAQTVGYVGEK